MSRNQLIFDRLFSGQVFAPRGDFEPRDWQMECSDAFSLHRERWIEECKLNGGFGQHVYTIFGGTGSGKTKAVAPLACQGLNGRWVRQIVVVCPNRSIRRKTANDFRKFFGIDLVPFDAQKHRDGVPLTKQGYILTYAHLIEDPELHARITRPETMVIFDEVHHLGQNNSAWGQAALIAFGHVPHIICLTGTPFRSDNSPIPFVTYEETETEGLRRFKADFSYTLGRAVSEGICRKPVFIFRDKENTKVQIRYSDTSPEIKVSFDTTDISDAISSARLRGAVQAGSIPRLEMLRDALAICREQRRKVAIFLGGDSESDRTPTVDATVNLPDELETLGYTSDDYIAVTGYDKEAQEKLDSFGTSDKWILGSVNIMSEGVDIPELSAAIFLTNVTSKQTTVQRIGRVLRIMGPSDPHVEALIFMFPDPTLWDLAQETEREILVEEARLKKKREAKPEGEGGDKRFRLEAIGVEDGGMGTVLFNGEEYPFEVWSSTRDVLRSKGLPTTFFAVGMALTLGGANGYCTI